MTTYAVTGATGRFGKIAINELIQLTPRGSVVAIARNTDKARQVLPEGVEIRPGDYEQPDQLAASFAGVDRLLFISSNGSHAISRLDQHRNVINAAMKAGVGYIAYTSLPKADRATSPLSEDHKGTEQAITASGIQHSFLRNNWYLENETALLKSAAAGKPFIYSAGTGRAGWAMEREYATAAAHILTSSQTKEIYELSGRARTYQELADAMEGTFDVVSTDDASYQKNLEDAGVNPAGAAMMTSFQALIRSGELDENSNDLADVLGHDLVPIVTAIREIIKN